ncbi:hypothetical protein [Brevundimonas sp.]|uniref:hypothetical protein n=1 Tax=Brevundimonas sp. TaxID=1871086 RepID=UPI002FC64C88
MAIILSGTGGALLMLALYFVFSMIFYALVAAAVLASVGLVLTTVYKYENFWPENDTSDTKNDRRALFVCKLFLIMGLTIGLVLRLANENGTIARTAFFTGAILLVSGMALTIWLRLRRYNRQWT